MKKQLIDIYKQDKEANEFIQKHLAEFTEESYNDITAIAPHVIQIKDVSVIVQNINLLKKAKYKNLMNDFFSGMTITQIKNKYKYKNEQTVSTAIRKLKVIIKKRFNKLLDLQCSVEMKKVDKAELKNKVKDITFNLNRNQVKIYIVKVKHKNRLNYKFFDEDVSMLYKKAKLLLNIISPLDSKDLNKILTRVPNPDDLKQKSFYKLKDILSKYRCVNLEGYFLPKVLDDAIVQILLHSETKTSLKHEYNQ